MRNEPCLTTAEGKPFGVTWLITAALAHPVWSQYALLLYDLTTPAEPTPQVYLDGATHEVLLFALDPAHPAVSAKALIEERQFRTLDPPNHGYQFTAKDDVAAVSRLQLIVDEIEARRLSPDTDFRAAWDSFFRDAHSLRRSRAGQRGTLIAKTVALVSTSATGSNGHSKPILAGQISIPMLA